MKIEPFGVEIWMDEWETTCACNLAETCVHSLTITELLQLVSRNSDDLSELLGMKMTYGATHSSDRLRDAITRGNLVMLAEWVDKEPRISWVKPKAGTTALLYYDFDMPSREFCVKLLQEPGVMFTPGSALGLEGCVRIGYANTSTIIQEGLAKVSEFLAKCHIPDGIMGVC